MMGEIRQGGYGPKEEEELDKELEEQKEKDRKAREDSERETNDEKSR